MAGEATHQIAVLGALGKGIMTLDDLSLHLPMTRNDIVQAAGRLVTRGLLERQSKGVFSLTAAGKIFLDEGQAIKSGPKGSRKFVKKCNPDTLRQRAWLAMRRLGRFTVPDIVTLAAKSGEKHPDNNIQKYVRQLMRSGHVAELPCRQSGSAETSNGFKTFRLVKDTGALSPVFSKGQVIDRNEQSQEMGR